MKKLSFNSITGFSISVNQFIAVTFLLSGTLAWFFMLQNYYYDLMVTSTIEGHWPSFGLIFFYGFGALSAFVGSLASNKISRRKLLIYWITLSIFTTLSLALFSGIIFLIIVSLLLGFCLGFGFPSCAALFAEITKIEERARVAGIVILIAFILSFLGSAIVPLLGLEIVGAILFLSLLRSIGFLSLVLDSCERKLKIIKPSSGQKKEQDKTFMLFLFPWVIFNVAAGLLGWWTRDPSEFALAAIGIQLATVLMGVSGLIGGSIADRYGRKMPVLFSLVLFGISFGMLNFTVIPESYFIYYATYGIAWGFLFTLYLTIPGDIASAGSKERYYAIGTVTPLIVYMFLSVLPEFLPINIPGNILSPGLTMILFLSMIPILRLSETWTERKRRDKQLREHAERVSKLASESENNG